ncbi:hypothetical protein B0J12DRAFT_68073 [Macrophomina phaseolina]|uniref:Uncharacterized protein n=1 Tax=Macrophomina phaseolina TaxID=35725 RepID=A0ABQ8GG24_9PEZI|nr:hypothetical protein B0J12DRAFT_68073 [Macrophomina phaseolina]
MVPSAPASERSSAPALLTDAGGVFSCVSSDIGKHSEASISHATLLHRCAAASPPTPPMTRPAGVHDRCKPAASPALPMPRAATFNLLHDTDTIKNGALACQSNQRKSLSHFHQTTTQTSRREALLGDLTEPPLDWRPPFPSNPSSRHRHVAPNPCLFPACGWELRKSLKIPVYHVLPSAQQSLACRLSAHPAPTAPGGRNLACPRGRKRYSYRKARAEHLEGRTARYRPPSKLIAAEAAVSGYNGTSHADDDTVQRGATIVRARRRRAWVWVC